MKRFLRSRYRVKLWGFLSYTAHCTLIYTNKCSKCFNFWNRHHTLVKYYTFFKGKFDDKNKFYNNLEDHLEQVKKHNIHLLVGDFNAKIGSGSHLTHPEVIARRFNFIDERRVSMCKENELRQAQMKFPHQNVVKVLLVSNGVETSVGSHSNKQRSNSLRNCNVRYSEIRPWPPDC